MGHPDRCLEMIVKLGEFDPSSGVVLFGKRGILRKCVHPECDDEHDDPRDHGGANEAVIGREHFVANGQRLAKRR